MEEERAFARRCLATDGREILSVRLGQSFTYDGYGNLLQKTVTQGSAPMLSVAVDPATNRIVGQSYDANGNLVSGTNTSYDVLNRLAVYFSTISMTTESYVYGPDNERVERKSVVTGGIRATRCTFAGWTGGEWRPISGTMTAQGSSIFMEPAR